MIGAEFFIDLVKWNLNNSGNRIFTDYGFQDKNCDDVITPDPTSSWEGGVLLPYGRPYSPKDAAGSEPCPYKNKFGECRDVRPR